MDGLCPLLLSLSVDSPGMWAAELCSQCHVGFGVWVGQSRGSQAPQMQFNNVILGFYEELLARWPHWDLGGLLVTVTGWCGLVPPKAAVGLQHCKNWCQPWICISGNSFLVWSSLKWSHLQVAMCCYELPEMHRPQALTEEKVFPHLHVLKDHKSDGNLRMINHCAKPLLLFMVLPSPCLSGQRVFCQGPLFCYSCMFYYETTEP